MHSDYVDTLWEHLLSGIILSTVTKCKLTSMDSKSRWSGQNLLSQSILPVSVF